MSESSQPKQDQDLQGLVEKSKRLRETAERLNAQAAELDQMIETAGRKPEMPGGAAAEGLPSTESASASVDEPQQPSSGVVSE